MIAIPQKRDTYFRLLYFLVGLEMFRARAKITLPFGASIYPVWRRLLVLFIPRSMRSPRALPDKCLGTPKGKVILARALTLKLN